MSKKNAMLALALAVLIPIFAAASAEAADVPDFRQIAGRQVKYENFKWTNPSSQHRHYKYSCSVDLEENFAEQWVSLVQRSGLFRLIANYERGWSNYDIDDWVFVYTGPKKKVPTFDTAGQDPYKAHLTISRERDYKRGITRFTIDVAARLTYGGDE